MTASVTDMVEPVPVPQQETELLQAALDSAKSARASARDSRLAIVVGGIVAVFTAAAAIYGTIHSADITASSAHAVTLGENRRNAYSAYLGDLADLDELLWDNLYWTDQSVPPKDAKDKFWATAEPLQARLAADVGRAKMLTGGNTAVRHALDVVDGLRGTMFFEFKCESGLQPCDKIPVAKKRDFPKATKRDQIQDHLNTNMNDVNGWTANLIHHATFLVGS
jgi:hypothetical protein